MGTHRERRSLLLPLVLVSLLAAGCGGDDTSSAETAPGPMAGPGTLDEKPFPEPTQADFKLDTALGIALSSTYLLVLFQDGVSPGDAQQAVASVGGRIEGALGEVPLAFVRLSGSLDATAARAILLDNPAVASAVEDTLLFPHLVPPPATGATSWVWAGDNQYTGELQLIGAPSAWNLRPYLLSKSISPVRVAVFDTGFGTAADVPLTYTAVSTPMDNESHGLQVASVIGATWGNRSGIDGVSPFVSLIADRSDTFAPLVDPASPGEASHQRIAASTFAMTIAHLSSLARSGGARVINLSLGYNWYDEHCDPTMPDPGCRTQMCMTGSATAPPCLPAPPPGCRQIANLIEQRICESALQFQAAVGRQLAARGILLVSSAGNDGFFVGFPARLASPWNYARWANPSLQPHMMIAEELKVESANVLPTTLDDESNVEGMGLAAPSYGVGAEANDAGGAPQIIHPHGTSFAAPMIAGAAAYLLAVEPRLSNQQLQDILVNQQTVHVPSGGSQTAVLDLFGALTRIDAAVPGRAVPVLRLLADMDDGTDDGFTRADASGNPYTGTRMISATPRVDMKDFRYLRDTRLLKAGSLSPCPSSVPSCDLNLDGVFEDATTAELYPRAQNHTGASGITDADVSLMASVWDGDPLQGWGPADLPTLLGSADLIVNTADFLARAQQKFGVSQFTLKLPGVGSPTTDIVITGASPTVILTTPQLQDASILVNVAGMDRSASLPAPALTPGEDRTLTLNPCALEDPPQGLLDAPTDCGMGGMGGAGGAGGMGGTGGDSTTLGTTTFTATGTPAGTWMGSIQASVAFQVFNISGGTADGSVGYTLTRNVNEWPGPGTYVIAPIDLPMPTAFVGEFGTMIPQPPDSGVFAWQSGSVSLTASSPGHITGSFTAQAFSGSPQNETITVSGTFTSEM